MLFWKRIPSARDVLWRLLALKAAVVHALASPPRDILEERMANWPEDESARFIDKAAEGQREFIQRIRKGGVWRYLTPSERAFLNTSVADMTSRQQLDFSWRAEAAQTLMWALGIVPELPAIHVQADPELLKQVPRPGEPYKPRLRPGKETESARDVVELWHWRSRTRQLIEQGRQLDSSPEMRAAGLTSFDDIVRQTARSLLEDGTFPDIIDDDFAVNGKAYRDLSDDEWSLVRSVTTERHHALNWLCGYAPRNRWDETPTDT